MACESCGSALPVQARFCPTCGRAILRAAPVAFVPRNSNGNGAAPPLPREELRAALGARAELGERMEQEVVEGFLGRVERAIDARVDARLGGGLPFRRRDTGDGGAIAVAITSLGAAIPITAIAGSMTGIVGVIVAWAGLASVNAAYNLRRRR